MISWLKRSWNAQWLGTIFGLVAGFGFAVWLNQPIPPWIELSEIEAVYVRGSKLVEVRGVYIAQKTCSRDEQKTPPEAPNPLVWRQEVQGTGPEIVNYAPIEAPPALEIGEHKFATAIPLKEGIEPDGWRVAVLVSCGNEPIAIRSRSVVVEYVNP